MTISRLELSLKDLSDLISIRMPPGHDSVLLDPQEARVLARRLNEMADLIDVREVMES